MEGRGRSRARKKAKFFSPKRLTSFLLAAAMVCTNIGSDLSTAYAAGTSSEVTFEMRGADLTAAVEEAIVSENVVTPDDLNFTNGKVDDFKGYLFGEGKLYEAYPEMEGGDVEADMRVFVRLPEDADDMYAVTGDEEVIFLYINNSDETVRFRSRINYMVDGEEKVKQTDSVTVRSYESIFGDEEVNVISDPVEEIPETTVPETETGEVPETPAEDPVATESEMTVSMSPNAAALVSAPGEEATPSEWPENETDAEVPETTAPEETTVPAEEEPAAEETTEAAETIPTATPSEIPAATDSEIENAPKPSYSDIVGIGWSGTAKIYASTLNKLHALDDVEGWKVEYSITPEGSARIVDGARGVEDGEDLYFGVKNQIGYAVETVLANGEELTADTITDNEDGSQTAWYAVYGVTEEQSIDVVMAETGEHPAFDAELTMEDGTVIHIHADEGVLPAGVTAEASVVTGIEDVVKENVEAEAAEAGEEKEVIASLSYNIDLLDADGGKLDDQIWSGVVEVTFTGALIEEHSKEADAVEIMHVETTKDEEPQADIQAEDVVNVKAVESPVAVFSVEGDTSVSFEAEHFSVYTVTFTNYSGNAALTVHVKSADTQAEIGIGNYSLSLSGYNDDDEIDLENVAGRILTDMKQSGYRFKSATRQDNLNSSVVDHLYFHQEKLYANREWHRFLGYGYYEYSNPVDTLYFWYEEAVTTITFDKNGGYGTAPEAIKKDAGTVIQLPGQNGMSYPGRVFSGWSPNRNANGEGQFTSAVYPAGSNYMVPERDTTLYAIWSVQNVDAQFYIRLDGQIPTEPQGHDTSEYTSAINIRDAIKIGTFYFNSADGVNDRLNEVPSDSQIKSVYSGYNPETQYVLWYVIKNESGGWHVDGVLLDKTKVNLTYDPNSPTFVDGTMPDGGQYYPGETATVGEEIPKREDGYVFVNWNTEQEGTGASYAPNDQFIIEENTTLYAQWRPASNTEYTVEYYYQKDGVYPEEAAKSVKRYGTTDAEITVTAEDKTPTRPGYVFDEAAEGNVLSGTIAGNGSLVLKVYFKEQFTVTYKPGDHGTFADQTTGSLDYGTKTPGFEGETTGAAGYTFAGWSPEVAETVTGNATYVAQWSANENTKYTVEYYYQEKVQFTRDYTG